MCGHFLDQADGRRTAKDARRDAAAEPRVGIPPAGSGSAGDLRSSFVDRRGPVPFVNAAKNPLTPIRALGGVCARNYLFSLSLYTSLGSAIKSMV